ncbi:MBL fold metallo-hydrolase [Ornithinibacillus sp. FSL M8-0202]|uniref:MBL fold metallo-hydrolase n=1 Tax=Ornithinibacillus sp. FSL M8-0202 TaxID=2921616 RepID=UPI0030CB5735
MYKKLIASLFLTIILTACGQGVSLETNKELATDIEKAQTEPTSDHVISDEQTEGHRKEQNNSKSTENLAELQVHYIDVGQADATLFQYGNHNILFDAGDWRGNEVVNYLHSQGVSKLDLVIGSHPDADHIGQLADVINTYEVTEVWLSGNESTSSTFQRVLEAIVSSGANYHEPRAGEEFDIGPLNLKVLHPQSITGKPNEESISVLFTYGDVKFLFTGDADRDAETQMMTVGFDVNADILQLGHHGSSTSSDPSFISAVSPEIAIYSAGADNKYGHPHREVISYITNAGIDLYGTDVNGTIIVTTDGKEYTVKTERDGTVPSKNSSSNNSSGDTANSNEASKSNEKANSSCIDINTASYEELQQIIHISSERAQDLIDLRPFHSIKDLKRINGIGDGRIKDIVAQGMACVS